MDQAWATPLGWATAAHLLVGNGLLGILKGWLASARLHLRWGSTLATILFAVIGSYVSSLLILAFVVTSAAPLAERMIPAAMVWRSAPVLAVLAGIGIWMLASLIEWPVFMIPAMVGHRGPGSALLLSLRLQAISGVLLTLAYLPFSYVTLSSTATVLPDAAFTKNPQAVVYYRGQDRDLWRIRLDGNAAERVMALPASDSTSLFLEPGKSPGVGALTMFADGMMVKVADVPISPVVEAGLRRDSEGRDIDLDISPKDAPDRWGWADARRAEAIPDPKTWTAAIFGYYLDSPVLTVWQGQLGARPNPTRYGLGFQTPWLRWSWNALTILPNDEAIAQLSDLIVLIDLAGRRVGLVARGVSPVVASVEAPGAP